MNLSRLNGQELARVDAALTELEAALDTLLERGICTESEGVDLEELSDAVAAELEFRDAIPY